MHAIACRACTCADTTKFTHALCPSYDSFHTPSATPPSPTPRDYLPAEAGGHAALGHIAYVRDSEGEEPDSDEDPDDDLDF